MNLNLNLLADFFDNALKEDHSIIGDLTSNLIFDRDHKVAFKILAKKDLVLSGIDIARYYFDKYLSTCSNLKFYFQDKDYVKKDSIILEGIANVKGILLIERVLLNFIQYTSSISTNCFNFIQKLNNPKISISDTRKILPYYKTLAKYALYCGGGMIHRPCLSSMIMIKDNHLAASSEKYDTTNIINKVKNKAPYYSKIEIECDNPKQVKLSVLANPDIIMLDNMQHQEIISSINIIRNHNINYKSNILIELSGGINIDNIASYREYDINYISSSYITNNFNVDISMEMEKI
ncbi:MAG TPA: carboxylating nicotinate-nucleotide diphosphorylase [Candidatus Megaira endosymbiont of Hartmannula sinica]|nr:carboxylating nicotinate-nucleotide diphosphorylase [Candidatus Megaera endosymbiont of Hartmannula sinica]